MPCSSLLHLSCLLIKLCPATSLGRSSLLLLAGKWSRWFGRQVSKPGPDISPSLPAKQLEELVISWSRPSIVESVRSGVHCETCLHVCVCLCVCVCLSLQVNGAGTLWGRVCPPGASRHWIDWLCEDSSCPHGVSVHISNTQAFVWIWHRGGQDWNVCAACASAVFSRCAGSDWERVGFFSVAGAGLCFVFVLRRVLKTQGCFCSGWAALTESRPSVLLSVPWQAGGWECTRNWEGSADPSWPRVHSKPYGIMLSM